MNSLSPGWIFVFSFCESMGISGVLSESAQSFDFLWAGSFISLDSVDEMGNKPQNDLVSNCVGCNIQCVTTWCIKANPDELCHLKMAFNYFLMSVHSSIFNLWVNAIYRAIQCICRCEKVNKRTIFPWFDRVKSFILNWLEKIPRNKWPVWHWCLHNILYICWMRAYIVISCLWCILSYIFYKFLYGHDT